MGAADNHYQVCTQMDEQKGREGLNLAVCSPVRFDVSSVSTLFSIQTFMRLVRSPGGLFVW